VSIATGVKQWETEVGDRPATATIDAAGRIWVTVQGDDELVVLSPTGALLERHRLPYGSAPYGIAAVPGRDRVVVATEGTGSLLSVDAGTGPGRGSVIDSVPVGPNARGVAVSGDGSDVLVTQFRPQANPTDSQAVPSAVVLRAALGVDGSLGAASVISLPADFTTADSEDQARGVSNYQEQVVFSPDGNEAWVPAKKDNVVAGRFRDGRDLTPETTVRSLVTRLDATTGSVVAAIDVNDRSAARAVAFTPDGDYAFVAHMESNQVTIVDAFTGDSVGALSDVGRSPVGLFVDASSRRLVVNDLLDRTASTYDISGVMARTSFSPPRVSRTGVVAAELLSPSELRGKRVFYDASDTRMTSNRYVSCASCHQDGDTDGQVWDFTQRGEGLRSTPSLFGLSGAGSNRLHFSANFDEIQDFENDIRAHFGGLGFMSADSFAARRDPLGAPKAGQSGELDDLAAYVRSLSDFPRSPARPADGALDPLAVTGRSVFASQSCAACHSGPTFTDGLRHDVGTVDASSGRLNGTVSRAIDTPSLRGVGLTGPYLHNGSAATLEAVLQRGHGVTAALSVSDSAALVRYLESLDGT